MLVIIDMQNQVLDPTSDFYVPGSEELVDRIAQRLAKALSLIHISEPTRH